MQKIQPLVTEWLNSNEKLTTTLSTHQKQMEQMTRNIATTSIVNNKNTNPVLNGGIHITCPGITSQEVARQVGVELNNMFNGFHNYTDQMSRIR